MKKLLVAWIAVAIIVLGGINIVNAFDGEMTDHEIMEQYILEEYGEDYHGEIYDADDEYITFITYESDNTRIFTSIDREYYANRYNE